MEGPNAALLQEFGTEDFYKERLEKRANLPALLSLLGPVGTAVLLQADARHRARQVQEAQVMNALLRQAAAERQRAVIDGFSGQAPAHSAQGRAAQEMSAMRARTHMLELMKQGEAPNGLDALHEEAEFWRAAENLARGGGRVGATAKELAQRYRGAVPRAQQKLEDATRHPGLHQAATAAKGGLVGALGGGLAGALIPSAIRPLRGFALGGGVGGTLGALAGYHQGSLAKRQQEADYYNALASLPEEELAAQLRQAMPAFVAARTHQKYASLNKEAFGGALLAPVVAGAKSLAKLPGRALAKIPGSVRAPAAGAAKAQAPAAGNLPALQGVGQAANSAARKPLIGFGTKAKLLGAGVGVGGAYGAYKGVQTARDYMMQPTYTSNQWGGRGMLPGQVNQYGYPSAY